MNAGYRASRGGERPFRSSASARSRGCSTCPLRRSAPGRPATASSSRSARRAASVSTRATRSTSCASSRTRSTRAGGPAEAHRLLAERVDRGDSVRRHEAARPRRGEPARASADCCKELLGTDAFEVLLASDPAAARAGLRRARARRSSSSMSRTATSRSSPSGSARRGDEDAPDRAAGAASGAAGRDSRRLEPVYVRVHCRCS